MTPRPARTDPPQPLRAAADPRIGTTGASSRRRARLARPPARSAIAATYALAGTGLLVAGLALISAAAALIAAGVLLLVIAAAYVRGS